MPGVFQNITVAPEFRQLVPTFLGAFIEAEVSVAEDGAGKGRQKNKE